MARELADEWKEWADERGGDVVLSPTTGLPDPLGSVYVPAAMRLEALNGRFELQARGPVIEFAGALVSRADPGVRGFVHRTIDVAGGTIEHHQFVLPRGMQRAGRGRAMLASAVDLAQHLGVSQIRTRAELVGRYAWARCGYAFAAGSREPTVRAIQVFGDELGFEIPDVAEPWQLPVLVDLDEHGEPVEVDAATLARVISDRVNPPDLSQLAGNQRLPLSRALLLFADYVGWDGVFDTTAGSACDLQLRRYTGR